MCVISPETLVSALLKLALGVDWISEKLGRVAAVAVLDQRDEVSNHIGTMHAGAMFTLGETASGGAMVVALRIASQVENAVIVSIVCDRGDRYLSTGVFPA